MPVRAKLQFDNARDRWGLMAERRKELAVLHESITLSTNVIDYDAVLQLSVALNRMLLKKRMKAWE